jgi:hypothetical protein
MRRVLIGLGTQLGSYLSTRGRYSAFYSYKQAINGISIADEAVVVAPAVKRLSGRDLGPRGEALAKALNKSAGRVVLLSSIDVYSSRGFPFDEASAGNGLPGRISLASFEQSIGSLGKRAIILRLPDPFGPYMRGISSVLLDQDASRINRVAIRQWYPVWRLEGDIALAGQIDAPLVNLCPEPLTMRAVLDKLFPGQMGYVRTPAPYSRVRTRYAEHFGGSSGYIMTADEVLNTIVQYVNAVRLLQSGMALITLRQPGQGLRPSDGAFPL